MAVALGVGGYVVITHPIAVVSVSLVILLSVISPALSAPASEMSASKEQMSTRDQSTAPAVSWNTLLLHKVVDQPTADTALSSTGLKSLQSILANAKTASQFEGCEDSRCGRAQEYWLSSTLLAIAVSSIALLTLVVVSLRRIRAPNRES
jgi:hypothetical protein